MMNTLDCIDIRRFSKDGTHTETHKVQQNVMKQNTGEDGIVF